MISRRPADIATATTAAAELALPLQVLSEPSQVEALARSTEPGKLLLIDADSIGPRTGAALHRQLDRQLPQPVPLLVLIGDSAQQHPLGAYALCTLPTPLQPLALTRVLTTTYKLYQHVEHLRAHLSATESALQQREQLLATLAHELRNPLCTIQNLVDVLILKPETFNGSINTLSRQVQQLCGIVDALYDYRYLCGAPTTTEEQPLDLRELLQRALETVRPKLAARDQQVRLSGDGKPAWVNGHQPRLIQVLANLLDNAGKYSAPGQTIEACVNTEDHWVVATIVDHGYGMEPTELARVFEPFVRGSLQRHEQGSGFGLGLAIVREFVTQHRGLVRAMSDGIGSGSSFEVRLPRSPTAPE